MSPDEPPNTEAKTPEKQEIKKSESKRRYRRVIVRIILPLTVFFHAVFALVSFFLIALGAYSLIGKAMPLISRDVAITMICLGFLVLSLCITVFFQIVKKIRTLGLAIMISMVFLVVCSFIFMAIFDVIKKDVLEYLSKSWDTYPSKARVDYQKTFNCCGFAHKRDRPAKNLCPSRAVNGCWGYQWNYLASNKVEIFMSVFGFIVVEVINFFSIYLFTIIK
jgi:hypothetical protein